MSPQRDWEAFSQTLTEIVNQHAQSLDTLQRTALIADFTKTVQRCQADKHTEHINRSLTAALKPLPMGIIDKAMLLDRALLAVESFLNIEPPLWHTVGADH
jgi:hypothetical protein